MASKCEYTLNALGIDLLEPALTTLILIKALYVAVWKVRSFHRSTESLFGFTLRRAAPTHLRTYTGSSKGQSLTFNLIKGYGGLDFEHIGNSPLSSMRYHDHRVSVRCEATDPMSELLSFCPQRTLFWSKQKVK